MFLICIIIPIVSTAIIGHILANDNIPKPSIADTAFPRPNPIARTRGTVTGPVVTPALSHPTFTNSSDEKKVNIDGGALALGHPLGATGARITGKAAELLKRENKKYALSTQCIGLGMGIATVIESID